MEMQFVLSVFYLHNISAFSLISIDSIIINNGNITVIFITYYKILLLVSIYCHVRFLINLPKFLTLMTTEQPSPQANINIPPQANHNIPPQAQSQNNYNIIAGNYP